MAKTETIIIRVTPQMKKDVEKLAKESRRELSDYLRLLFEDIIKERGKKN